MKHLSYDVTVVREIIQAGTVRVWVYAESDGPEAEEMALAAARRIGPYDLEEKADWDSEPTKVLGDLHVESARHVKFPFCTGSQSEE